jgi:hypothetical protein
MPTDRKLQEDANTNIRVSVDNAYGFIKGMETTTSFYAVTFEEMVQQQMDRLTGNNLGGRSAIERMTKIRNELTGAIQAIKSIPPDQMFSQEDNNATCVNTPEQ